VRIVITILVYVQDLLLIGFDVEMTILGY
jgi:hypothetical protein